MGMKNSILVIDDDADFLAFMVDSLQSLGYKVTTAPDGMQAFIQAESLQPKLIITDIQMPVFGSGVEAYRKMRENEYLKHTPIIFVTGLKPDKAREMVPSDDPKVRLVFKPIDGSLLKRVITELLGEVSP